MKKELWGLRVRQYLMLVIKYSKYVLSGHTLIVGIFLLGWAAVKYDEWVMWLSANVSLPIISSILLSFVIVRGSVRTFLNPADIVFLLPLDKKIHSYFIKSLIISMFSSIVFVGILFYILIPIVQYREENITNVTALVLSVFLLKFLILALNFLNNFVFSLREKIILKYIYFFINCVLLLKVMVNPTYSFLILLYPLFIVFTFKIAKKKPIPWEQLINQEQRTLQRFFNVINMFVDVPMLQNKLHERRYIKISKKYVTGSKSFSFLVIRSFIRVNEYFGIVVRLTLIGMLVIFFIDNVLICTVIMFIILYATWIQLTPLKRQYRFMLWVRLYPIREEEYVKEINKLITYILFGQLLFIACLLVFNGLITAGKLFLVGCVLILLLNILNRKAPILKKK